MTNIRQYKITFKNIKEGEIPCDNPTIKLLGVSDGIVQKCEFKNNSVTFSIFEDAIDGLQGKCINFTILCETCGKCKPKPGKLCFCNDFTDCEECQDCINGVCVNRCPDMVCVDGRCQNCGDPEDCAGNLECIGGKCTCPPTLPYYDEVAERCYGCQTDAECGPCYRCIDGNCVRLDCVCNEDLDKCVECNAASDCPLPNQCCVNNKCVCCPGYVWDPVLEQCVEEPECTEDSDCGDCEICVNGDCEPIPCPNPNEICVDGKCGPIPCDGPCSDATDCGPDCGCLNGECVDCASLDCVTCAQTIGCKCVNGDCKKDNDPCSQYSCDTNCGDRPDCGCQEDGSCDPVDCSGISTLEKNEDNCQLVYNLETSECCPCSDITIDNKFVSAQINTGTGKLALVSRVEVRKGSVTNPLGVIDIHRVDEDQYDDIMDNEEPTQGQVRVTATYKYKAIPSGLETTEVVNLTPIFDVAGVGYSQQTLQINIPGREYPSGLRTLKSVTLTYTLISELTFESGCTYNQDTVIGTYLFTDATSETNLAADLNVNTPGHDSNALYWIAKTLTSTACRNPEARWYKAVANSTGAITNFETVPFRKSYLTKLTPTTFTDYVDEPDENPGPTDNNGELFSGWFYKVATDCACTNEATAYYESTCENPGRLVFCDPQTADVSFDPCGKKFTFDTAFITDCLPNYDYYGDNASFVPDSAKLRYSIFVNGSTTPVTGSTKIADITGLIYNAGQQFTATELIQFIEIKFSHDNCDECTIRIDSDVDLDLPNYSVICEPSDSLNTTFIITFTDWTGITSVTVNGNIATSGSPTVSITVANGTTELTGNVQFASCPGTVPMTIQLPENCCDDLVVNLVQDVTDCDGLTYDFVATVSPSIPGVYSFSVNGTFASSNSTGLFSTNKNIGGSEPNTVSVSFDPSAAGCENVVNSVMVDKTNTITINSNRDDSTQICGSSTEVVVFATTGYTGDVTYTVTGDGTSTDTLDGLTDLSISVSGDPNDTKLITIVSNTLQDINGNTCIAFNPTVTTFQWIDEPSLDSVDISPAEGCEGDAVTFTVVGVGSTATISMTNFLGTPLTTVNLNQEYTVYLGSSNNDGVITVSSVHAGDCDVDVIGGATFNILPAPEITDFEYVCETPGSPSSNIIVTVLATASSTVVIAADEGNVSCVESPAGTYTGTIDSSNGGDSVTVTVTKAGCTDSQTYDIVACGCDPDFEVEISLNVGPFTPISTDSGCVDEVSTYKATPANGNPAYTYEWFLGTVGGTLLGTASTLAYTYVSGAKTVWVRVTDDEGCTTTDSIVLTGYGNPVATITGDSTPCLDEGNVYNVTYTNGPISSYQWQLDGVNTVTTASYTYTPVDTDPHDISVVIINSHGCASAEATLEVTAVDCCEICATTDVFIRQTIEYNRLKDINNTVFNISGPGVLSGNGAFTKVDFECVPTGNPSTANDDSALDLQEAIAALPGQCGTPLVAWESVTEVTSDCLSETFNVPTGTSGIWFRGCKVNGTTYATNDKIANATAGALTSYPVSQLSSENSIEARLAYAFQQEGIGAVTINAQLPASLSGANMSTSVEVVGVDTATVLKFLYSTTNGGAVVEIDVNNIACVSLTGTAYEGQCIKLTVTNSSIYFATIYVSGDIDPGDTSAFIGPCNPV